MVDAAQTLKNQSGNIISSTWKNNETGEVVALDKLPKGVKLIVIAAGMMIADHPKAVTTAMMKIAAIKYLEGQGIFPNPTATSYKDAMLFQGKPLLPEDTSEIDSALLSIVAELPECNSYILRAFNTLNWQAVRQ